MTWKTIKGYDNYLINEIGIIRSANCIIKPFKQHGYMKVSLYKEGKKRNFFIHRLVAGAFIPNPDNLPFINHKNHIRTDNSVNNLQWCDAVYNCRYSLAKPIIGYNKK